MLGLLALHQAGTFAGPLLRASPSGRTSTAPPADVEHLVTFLVAGLTASS
jgi:hypothetical protein